MTASTSASPGHGTLPPVIFLPQFSRGNKVPFKVTDVSIVENTISFTVVPMNATERTDLMEQIRQPTEQQ